MRLFFQCSVKKKGFLSFEKKKERKKAKSVHFLYIWPPQKLAPIAKTQKQKLVFFVRFVSLQLTICQRGRQNKRRKKNLAIFCLGNTINQYVFLTSRYELLDSLIKGKRAWKNPHKYMGDYWQIQWNGSKYKIFHPKQWNTLAYTYSKNPLDHRSTKWYLYDFSYINERKFVLSEDAKLSQIVCTPESEIVVKEAPMNSSFFLFMFFFSLLQPTPKSKESLSQKYFAKKRTGLRKRASQFKNKMRIKKELKRKKNLFFFF